MSRTQCDGHHFSDRYGKYARWSSSMVSNKWHQLCRVEPIFGRYDGYWPVRFYVQEYFQRLRANPQCRANAIRKASSDVNLYRDSRPTMSHKSPLMSNKRVGPLSKGYVPFTQDQRLPTEDRSPPSGDDSNHMQASDQQVCVFVCIHTHTHLFLEHRNDVYRLQSPKNSGVT